MEILNIEVNEKIIKDSIPEVIRKIYLVCKNDDNLKSKDKIQQIEKEIIDIDKKIRRTRMIAEQAGNLKKTLITKISNIDNQNTEKRDKLLEDLGIDI